MMEPGWSQKIAITPGVAAVLATLTTERLPRWLRITLVFSLAGLAGAAGLLGYRYATRPAMLTVAAGSIDGDATRLMSNTPRPHLWVAARFQQRVHRRKDASPYFQ
jgi:hypothetical protein